MEKIIPDGISLLGKVNLLLYQKNITDNDLQESILSRYLSRKEFSDLKELIAFYDLDFQCDFKQLQEKNHKDLIENTLFTPL